MLNRKWKKWIPVVYAILVVQLIGISDMVVQLIGMSAMAADKLLKPEPSWAEHLDVVTILVGGLFTVLVFFAIRTLKQIDKNQAILFDKINNLTGEFLVLKGEHQALTQEHHAGSHRCVD